MKYRQEGAEEMTEETDTVRYAQRIAGEVNLDDDYDDAE
ncbi:MAG: hypothetical protein J07HQX50_01759 [Haloquadratum sp. J07HQX50]|nr:MAG: hypothetical protein J07HQX50_01759 [Haloquadratum sp. J07HQX50]